MRLYLDHDVDVAFAARLQSLGHDVVTTREVGRTESVDEQQLVFATHEGRVFLTHNRRAFVDCIVNRLKKAVCTVVSSFRPTCFLTSWNGVSFVFLPHIWRLTCRAA